MRLLIDLQSCQSGSRMGGIGRYSLDLAKAMVKLCPDDEVIILLNDQHKVGEAYVRRAFLDLLPPEAIKVCAIPPGSAFLSDSGRTARVAEAIRNNFIQQLAPDAVHVSSVIEGYGEDIVTSIPEHAGIITAVTLYDLIPLQQPEVYLKDRRTKIHYYSKVAELQKADLLLGISGFSAKEGIEHLNAFDGVVVDIRGGVDPSFKPMQNARAAIAGISQSLGIDAQFFLYTASFDQRKNQKGLIEAFSLLPKSIQASRQLVIVGNGWQGAYDELHAYGASLGVPQDRIVFTGRVTDEELHALYSSCELFVFPSFWEGLGMPVLEAMACGAAVIGSNTTSVPEVLGWEDASFDPFDSQAIADKITQALTQPEFMAALKDHGSKHCLEFTWEESARRALTAIRDRLAEASSTQVAESGSTTDDVIAALKKSEADAGLIAVAATCLASNEIELGRVTPTSDQCKIGWVSSWANRCGIATYSANLLRHFARDVIVFGHTDETLEAEENVVRAWTQGKDQTLFDLNDAVAKNGVTDVFIQFNYGFYNFEALNWFIATQVMSLRRVYITLHSTNDPEDEYGHRLLDLKGALIQCSRIFVHNDIDVERLAALGVVGNVTQIPHGLRTLPPQTSQARADRKPAGKVLAAYGFFLPHKGLPELVEALALLRRGGREVILRLVNADYGDSGGVSRTLIEETKALADTLGVGPFVEFETRFLPDEQSVELLRTADLLVYPYQNTGESASGAVRMGLTSGVPLAVTPLSIFDDVRRAAFTLPGVAPKDIAAGIASAFDALDEGTPLAKQTLSTADLLRRIQAYSSVSPHIETIIQQDAMRERWMEYFVADPGAMMLIQGELRSGAVVSTGGGVVSYGPYIALTAGLYRIVVRGSVTPAESGACGTIEVRASGGTQTFATLPLEVGGDGVIMDRKFRTPETLNDVEFIISVADGGIVEINSYQLSQRLN